MWMSEWRLKFEEGSRVEAELWVDGCGMLGMGRCSRVYCMVDGETDVRPDEFTCLGISSGGFEEGGSEL